MQIVAVLISCTVVHISTFPYCQLFQTLAQNSAVEMATVRRMMLAFGSACAKWDSREKLARVVQKQYAATTKTMTKVRTMYMYMICKCEGYHDLF